jgi:hypothetical protein
VTGVTPVGVPRNRSFRLVDISSLTGSASLQSLLAAAAGPSPTTAPTATAPSSSGASSSTSPALEAANLLASSESELFSSISGGATAFPDLSGLTATAQAYSLYTNPAMLQQLAGGATPASAAASGAAAGSTGAVFTPPAYSFNPFDEASWWSSPSSSLGATVDTTA